MPLNSDIYLLGVDFVDVDFVDFVDVDFDMYPHIINHRKQNVILTFKVYGQAHNANSL